MARDLGRTRLAIAAALLAAGMGAAATTALATAPADNGPIVFRRYLGPERTLGAIFTVAADGTGERRVTAPPGRLSDDFPDFASDSSFIAFQRCNATCRIFTVRPDATRLEQVGPGCTGRRLPPKCSDSSYPAVAPNRRRIAFVRAFGRIRNDQFDHVGIYVMATDGSHVRQVTLPRRRAAEDHDPQWSPDGRRIVFVRFNITARPANRQAIFTVRANGTDRRRVTPWALAAGDGPDWSPDGSRIIFRAPETDDFLNSDFFTIRPDGTGLRQITHAPAGTRIYSSSFSPDGTSITFGMTGVDDMADVFTMHADGTAVTPVTRSPQWDSAPDWGGVKR